MNADLSCSRRNRLAISALLGAGALLASAADAAAPVVATAAHPVSFAEHQARCAGKDGWSDPAPPIRVFANVYDIGTCGIVVLLIAGPQGHVVIDAATNEAAPSIIANIERLGLRPADVKLLLSSHEHLDHAGGLRALQRRTRATMIATTASARALATGIASADDPQRRKLPGFPGVKIGRVVRDGELVQLGQLRLTAHITPGHAPGSTSWSWRSCEGGTCREIVYADSLTAVAADGYRFTDHPAYVARLRATMGKIARMRCDLVITPHPAVSNLYERLAGTMPLVDVNGCDTYAKASEAKLNERLASER